MPRRVVTVDGTSFLIREYDLPPLAANEVRVQVEFAAPKHGTETHLITGSSFGEKEWDPELRLFKPRENAPAPPAAHVERGVGNMIVGTVLEAGSGVTRVAAGQRVFGYGAIREMHQGPESKLWPLEGLDPLDAVCIDPAHVAFVAVRDGNIRIADDVAVFGLGAIGLLAVQIARAGGARRIFAVDPIAPRREAALRFGATAAFDPTAVDAGLEIKRATAKAGVDVSIETSGSGRALHESIRCLRQCGTVVHVPWGPRDASGLRLDEEFHLNRPTIVGSQAWEGWANPDRDTPRWNWDRAYQAAIDLMRDGTTTGQGIITPVVDFEDAPAALEAVFHHPENTIKLGVRFADTM